MNSFINTLNMNFPAQMRLRLLLALAMLIVWPILAPADTAITNSTSSANETEPILSRTFQVDPGVFYRALKYSSRAPKLTITMEGTQGDILKVMAGIGVDLDPAKGKSLFLHDWRGSLMVRATEKDLNRIEAWLKTLELVTPQVHIQVKALELDPRDQRASDLEFFLAAILPANHTTTQATSADLPAYQRANTNLPLPRALGTLTKAQLSSVMTLLKEDSGVKAASPNEVTGLSGHEIQARMREAAPSDTAGDLTSNEFTLDVIPCLRPGEKTIDLMAFLSQPTPGKQAPFIYYPIRPDPITAAMHQRISVEDGQTLVLTHEWGEPVSNGVRTKRTLFAFVTLSILPAAGK